VSEIEARCLDVVRGTPGLRASDIGWALWGATCEAPGRGSGSHAQAKFCRSAGRLLNRLRDAGAVRAEATRGAIRWYASRESTPSHE